MKLNKSEKTGSYTWEVEMFLEPDEFKEAISKVFRREGKKYNVPGFRKGKAPRNLVEKMYGEDVFYYDAVNEVFPTAYDDAVKELDVEPVARPEAELVSANQEDGAVLKLVITVKPELKVGKYKGFATDKFIEEVDERAVEYEIEQLRERNARIITREGAAQDGDIANINFEGFLEDGTPFDGGKDEGFKLTLGSGQFIPGFEEQVVGHEAGEEFDVNVTFPEEYHAEDLAGKSVVFKVKLNEVQTKEQPDLDDEFAKDVSEFDTLEELNKSIRERLQKEKDEKADNDAEARLVEQVAETIEGEIPAAMYENRIDEMVQDFNFRLQQQGLNLETYMQFSGNDPQQFRDGFREQAERAVRIRLAMEEVARLENLEVTEEDIEAEIKRIAGIYNMEEEQVKNLMPADEIKKDLLVGKAADFVKQNSKITEKPIEEAEAEAKADAEKPEKKAEKKPAAKKASTAKKAPAKKAKDEKAEDTE